jgi:uncharacterized membrane protein YkvA (DUF1232 family)
MFLMTESAVRPFVSPEDRVPRIRGPFIEPPVALDAATRRTVLAQFAQAIEVVGEPEEKYVDDRLPKILIRLKKQFGWYGDMAQVAEFLHRYVIDYDGSDPLRCRRIGIAALFYLCDPFDVVPDFSPAVGYVDDALVLNQAITELRAESPKVAATIRTALRRHKYARHTPAR